MWSRRADNTNAAIAVFQQPPSPGQVKAAALALLVLAAVTVGMVVATWGELLPRSILLPLVVGYSVFSVGYVEDAETGSKHWSCDSPLSCRLFGYV